jgi:two-component system response regulator
LQSATSGGKAIEYLRGEGEYFDRSRFPVPGLIMTDLRMADGDGFWLLQRLKSNPEWMDIRRVVLTGSSYPGDIKKAHELGACAYHLKPGANEDLVKLLKTMFDYWLTSEVAPSLLISAH